MRRSLSFRFASAMLAVRFAVMIVQPNGMPGMTMAGMASARAESAGTDDMAGMAGMAGHETTPPKQDHSSDCARHDCCCVIPPVLAPRGAELSWAPAEALVDRELLPPVQRAEISPGEHVIPFAIGPPRPSDS